MRTDRIEGSHQYLNIAEVSNKTKPHPALNTRVNQESPGGVRV